MNAPDASDASGGLVVLVGAGPGAESLVTLEGLDWLSRADVVVYDRLAAPALLSHAHRAELIYVGKAHDNTAVKQQDINELLIRHARRGALVVRLKGGDPLVFARGGEELSALKAAGVDFRVVPGVTAAVAAAAYAGIPLTDRRVASTVALVTGHEDADKGPSGIRWDALAGIDTLVFYMGVATLGEIAERLMRAGRDRETPVALVADASLPTQRTVITTLSASPVAAVEHGLKAPALVIVGRVVTMRGEMAWFEDLPLHGQRVIVTRSGAQSAGLLRSLGRLGADVIEAPAVQIEPPADFGPLDGAIRRLREFSWLVVTSANGVEMVFSRLSAMGLDSRALAGVKVAAVGPATAEALAQRGVRADLVPQTFTTAELGGALLASAKLRGARLLLARSDIASPELSAVLRQNGATVEEVCAYRTAPPTSLPPRALDALSHGHAHWIVFASASAVRNFLNLAGEHRRAVAALRIAAIGPVTAAAVRELLGTDPTLTAEPHTAEAIADAMAAYERGRGRGTPGK